MGIAELLAIKLPISVAFGVLRLTGAVAAAIYRWRRQPWIEVSAQATDPWIRGTRVPVEGRNPIQAVADGRATYYRVKVENTGAATATGCRLRLANVYYASYGVWQRLDRWEAITLNWSNRADRAPIELAAGESAFCDLGHTFSNFIANNRIDQAQVRRLGNAPAGHPALLYLDSAVSIDAQPNALAGGKYALELQFVSTNAKTRDFGCYLVFVGDYAALIGEPPEGTEFQLLKRLPEEKTLV